MSIVARVKQEIREIAVTWSYFLMGTGLIFLVFKLMLDQYDIRVVAFSKAAFGALILAKVVVLLRDRKVMNHFKDSPGYVSIAYKTLVYVFGVFIVLFTEKTLERLGEAGGFFPAIKSVFQSRDLTHIVVVTLMTTIFLLFYCSFEQLGDWFGRENFRAAFTAEPGSREEAVT